MVIIYLLLVFLNEKDEIDRMVFKYIRVEHDILDFDSDSYNFTPRVTLKPEKRNPKRNKNEK